MRASLLAAAVSSVALVNAASAADAVVEEVVIVDASAPTWSGFYAGVHGGYAWADRDWNGDFIGIPIPDNQFNFDMDGAVAGAQVGYNWQVNNFVFGVEADASWSDASERTFTPNGIFGTEVEASMDWMATVRGRVGYAWDRFLVYGTGGVAFARVDTDVNQYAFNSQISSDSSAKTHTGWTIGVGGEAMITEKISLKLEYLYADLGKKDYDYDLIPISDADDTFGSADLKVSTVRVGLNFHF